MKNFKECASYKSLGTFDEQTKGFVNVCECG
jgi:hypothetical protein